MIEISKDVIDELCKYSIELQIDNTVFRGWFKQGSGKHLLIYYGGNGENITQHFQRFLSLNDLSLLFVNYRGYYKSEGKPSEKQFYNDALKILDIFSNDRGFKTDKILLMGRSLGTCVACHVASKRNVRGLILSTPLDSVVALAQRQVPFFPMKYIIKHKFDNIKVSSKISMPILILLAGIDKKVPHKNSLKIVASLPNVSKVVTIHDYNHRTIKDSQCYWDEINQFMKCFIS